MWMHPKTVHVHPGIQEMAVMDAATADSAPSLVELVPYLHVGKFE